jgi:hypothetical protein
MRRLFLLVVLLGLVAIAVLIAVLGAFPPEPKTQHVEKRLENTTLQHGQP